MSAWDISYSQTQQMKDEKLALVCQYLEETFITGDRESMMLKI